jgi:hypothetical protein
MNRKVPQSPIAGNCPDLRKLVGGVYRTGRDPAFVAGDRDPWMVTLPGRYGEIYPFGKDRLAVEVFDSRIASRVGAVAGAIPYQRGEWHWTFTFHYAYLDAVAAIIQPAKVRRMSAAAKKRLAAIGGSTRFGAPNTALDSARERQDAFEPTSATDSSSIESGAVVAFS